MEREAAAEGGAEWPVRLRELAIRRSRGGSSSLDEQDLRELWTLLSLALHTFARSHARRVGGVLDEDLRDVVSEKASDLLRRLDQKDWNPEASAPPQLCAYLSTVARNGVVDFARLRRKETRLEEGREGEPVPSPSSATNPGASRGDAVVERREYASAIRECASRLTSRARLAWFLRVFYEMPSVEIARHPGIGTTAAAVDAMLARCREQMRTCVSGKGFETTSMPAGTFTLLWEILEAEES